ncbi:MAG: hypothetical protein F6K58_07510 [Symploca sp. SIO2E9]|nr:hypothetical protein [Symploca sp. SIO2E9]
MGRVASLRRRGDAETRRRGDGEMGGWGDGGMGRWGDGDKFSTSCLLPEEPFEF